MKWRKLNRVLHRDIGYLFFGMSIIYGLSGIALNHIDDWDPSYNIRNEQIWIEPGKLNKNFTGNDSRNLLQEINVDDKYKSHYYPSKNILKIFVKGGSVTLNIDNGSGIIETVNRRPVFFEFNFLHYNNPKFLWTWFADLYGTALILMAITGILMIQGKKGFSGRGKWYVVAGILIPVIFLILYL
jgi:hypothetical protein